MRSTRAACSPGWGPHRRRSRRADRRAGRLPARPPDRPTAARPPRPAPAAARRAPRPRRARPLRRGEGDRAGPGHPAGAHRAQPAGRHRRRAGAHLHPGRSPAACTGRSGVTLAGYALGSRIPNVDRYLLPIVAVIVVVSLIPTAGRHRRHRPAPIGLFDPAARRREALAGERGEADRNRDRRWGWPAAAARACACPVSQYARAAEAPVAVSQYSVMLSTTLSRASPPEGDHLRRRAGRVASGSSATDEATGRARALG